MKLRNLFSNTCLFTAISFAVPICFTEVAKGQEGDAFLWEIESQNNTVYLLGSIHLLKETDYPLPQSIQNAFDDAENIVFEVDLGDLENPNTLETIIQAALPDSPDELFSNALPSETYSLAEETASSIGLTIEVFNSFEPWFFFINIPTFQLVRLGFDPDFGLDVYLFNEARTSGKNILVFETLEEQLNFFDDLPVQTQAELVEQTISEFDILESSFTVMTNAWKSGDIATFERIVLEGFIGHPEVYDILLTQRNQDWLSEVESFINQSEDYLVVVGAAHLVGDDSLIQLLQERNYTVQQLSNS